MQSRKAGDGEIRILRADVFGAGHACVPFKSEGGVHRFSQQVGVTRCVLSISFRFRRAEVA